MRGDRARARLVGAAATALAAPALAVAAPFWATSALTRWLPGRLGLEPTTASWTGMMRYAPEVGWQMRENLDLHAYADDLFHLSTDAEGWRGPTPLDEADAVVIGDSFALGHGVDDARMYTRYVGATVKPLGSDGYSMVHAVLWLERLRDRIAGKPVFWMVYAGNDLYDNLRPNYGRYRMPYVRRRDGRWEIHTSHVSPEPWPIPGPSPHYPTELARMCTPGYESDRALEAAGYLIGRAAAVCEAAGCDLTILSVPRRSQIDPERIPELLAASPDPATCDPRRPDEGLARNARAHGVRFVALADHLTADDYQDRDIHWRPSGHRKVGRLLDELLSGSAAARVEHAGASARQRTDTASR